MARAVTFATRLPGPSALQPMLRLKGLQTICRHSIATGKLCTTCRQTEPRARWWQHPQRRVVRHLAVQKSAGAARSEGIHVVVDPEEFERHLQVGGARSRTRVVVVDAQHVLRIAQGRPRVVQPGVRARVPAADLREYLHGRHHAVLEAADQPRGVRRRAPVVQHRQRRGADGPARGLQERQQGGRTPFASHAATKACKKGWVHGQVGVETVKGDDPA
mmetsp:Transcript_64034/g.198245  ORF Transcript_64034/g.198245 Transcript_64034/m.198245 type:complete len:218 (+) Transcript_64034:114-767(+)